MHVMEIVPIERFQLKIIFRIDIPESKNFELPQEAENCFGNTDLINLDSTQTPMQEPLITLAQGFSVGVIADRPDSLNDRSPEGN